MAFAPSRRVACLLRSAALTATLAVGFAGLLALTAGPTLAQSSSDRLGRARFSSDAVTRVETDARTGVPTFLAGRLRAAASGTPDAIARQFVTENAAVFGLGERDRLVTRAVDTDALGTTHVRLQQTVGGVLVFGGDAVVHLDRSGAVYAYSGHLRADASGVALQPALGADAALAAARADVRAEVERPADELAAWTPTAHLVVVPTEDGAVLAYHVRLYQDRPTPANWEVFVDAQTGRVIERWNAIHTAVRTEAPALSPFVAAVDAANVFSMTPVTGTGSSLYSGTVSIPTDRVSATSFRLYDTTRGSGIHTRDGRNGTSLPGVDITDTDNNFTATAARAGVDAHWGAVRVYDYYLGTHSRNSYNNAGAALNSTVHHQSRYNNAFWNGTYMVYGDGDGSSFSALVELDICAHELTHAVTERTAGLVYNREPGALNEAVSDIFAAMVDRDDWWVGERSYTPGTANDALRYLDTPTRGGQPDTYANRLYPGSCTPSSGNDYCGVHTNSGIPNHAAYLMAAGGTKGGVTVAAIGREATERIWYRALTSYFTSTTDFAGARAGTIQAATDLYGAGSAQVTGVTNGWASVGVGSGGTTPPPTGGQWYYVTQAYNSPHNYPNNYNASNTYSRPGATQVAMYMAQFATEANYDFVYIRDAAGAVQATHTGSKAAFWAVVPGSVITANLVSDYSVTAYGYRVSQVAYYATTPLAPGDVPMVVAPVSAPGVEMTLGAGGTTAAKGVETGLAAVRPNPSSATAGIAFALAEAGEARIAVVDVLGREVLVLHEGTLDAGAHTQTVAGLAPGTYLVVFDAAGRRFTQPMTVVR